MGEASYYNEDLWKGYSTVKAKTRKEYYYERLMRLRYEEGLDRDIIPNIDHLYEMETRPSRSSEPIDFGRVLGGLFELEFDSSEEDDFFYGWFLSGEMHDGGIFFYKGQYQDQLMRIRFWDCYCVNIGEHMSAYESPYPTMKMGILISPAITENRGSKHEKPWRVTEK